MKNLEKSVLGSASEPVPPPKPTGLPEMVASWFDSTYCIPILLKLCLLIHSRASVPQTMHVMAIKIEATKAVQGMKGSIESVLLLIQ